MRKNKINLLSDKSWKKLMGEGFLHYVFTNVHYNMPDEIFSLFLNHISLISLEDRCFLEDQRIRKLVNWNKVNRRQLIRLMTRDISILDKIDLKEKKFRVDELEFFLKFHPDCVNRFDIDFDNLLPKEYIVLLNIDPNFCDYCDLKTIPFDRLQLQEIVKKFVQNEKIMNKLDFDKFDNYIKRQILKKTGEKYIDRINIKLFNALDWVDLILKRPSFFNLCDKGVFIKDDCFYLVKIAGSVPEAYNLIVENKDKISGLGWEKLLLLDYQKYSPICNWKSLKNLNFKILKKVYPEIEQFKSVL